MKIARIETFLVRPDNRNYIFVRVWTDEGLYGIGEAYSVGPDEAVAAVIADFEQWLVGRDPRDVEFLWQLMYNVSRFPGGVVTNAAISGIEHALWDIKGKALGVPVYELLGGKCRDRVRVYVHAHGATPGALAEDAAARLERYGCTAVKVAPQPPESDRLPFAAVVRQAVARLEALRRALGDGVDIAVDPHAKIFEPVRALQLAQALKPYNPFFLEEPLRPENIDALAALRRQVDLPLATGEMLYTKYAFRDLLVRGAADIVQPDVCCAGGLLEQKKIAAMAEAFYATIAPHNPLGPVATAVNVHLAAGTPNFLILEYLPDDTPGRRDLVDEPMRLVDGHLELPTRPGLGLDLNVAAFAAYPPARWRRAVPLRADGSLGYP
ncbi:MAG TPA: galactonate dehydratase [Thermomicrobiales bacterium]|nr:galactonate dehydratase [Thermomicrobiales bacterium]